MTDNAVAKTETPDTLDLGKTLADLGRELHHAAESCAVLQWSISTLLEKVHHPDLAAEIHMLQDIDRLQQTLADLSSLLAVSAGAANGSRVSSFDIGGAIRLESLRSRLGLANDAAAADGSGPDGGGREGITWL